MSEPDDFALVDPAAGEALRPILDAGALSRFRLLDVVCPNDHRLVQVVRTPEGPVIVGEGPHDDVSSGTFRGVRDDGRGRPVSVEDFHEWRRRRHRGTRYVLFLDAADPNGGADDAGVVAECRCRTTVVALRWIRGRMRAGKRRARWLPRT